VAGGGERLLVARLGARGDLRLLLGVREHDGAVLGADVVALAVALGGVVALPERPQELLVGDLLRVEDDEDGLRVARAP
jgi:hypothetical protein